MSRTICIKGTGRVELVPDTACVNISMSEMDTIYNNSIEKVSLKVSRIRDALAEIHLDEKYLSTGSFNVRAITHRKTDKNGRWLDEQVFDGYRCDQNLMIEFPFASELLADVINAIMKADVGSDISVCYYVKDKNTATLELLRTAAIDAKSKSTVLCEALGSKLGDLLKIEYNWTDINLRSPTVVSFDELDRDEYKIEDVNEDTSENLSFDICPEKIVESETVNFIFAIS